MKPAAFLASVMAAAVAAIPTTLWYLVKVKQLHKPENERSTNT